MSDLASLEEIIGCKFKNQGLLQQALVHRSYINEHRHFEYDHNERLEFLGDAVLELVVTDHLYQNYELPEGELTNLRAAVVIFGQRQIERASVLGDRQMQVVFIDMLPTQRSGFHAAQPGQEQQPIICPVDRVKERRHLAVPLRKVIYAPRVWLLVVPFY